MLAKKLRFPPSALKGSVLMTSPIMKGSIRPKFAATALATSSSYSARNLLGNKESEAAFFRMLIEESGFLSTLIMLAARRLVKLITNSSWSPVCLHTAASKSALGAIVSMRFYCSKLSTKI